MKREEKPAALATREEGIFLKFVTCFESETFLNWAAKEGSTVGVYVEGGPLLPLGVEVFSVVGTPRE